jgi:uncharacterized membrane protein
MDNTSVKTNRELRLYARSLLEGGVWKKMALTVFVSGLLYIPVYLIVALGIMYQIVTQITLVSVSSYIVIMLLSCAISGPLAIGLAGLYLKRIRGGEIATGNVFNGFNRFWDGFLLALLRVVFIGLWSSVIIVPAIILKAPVLILFSVIPGIAKGYSYSMASYIMHDNPGMRPMEAINESRRMMIGSKSRLFSLHLSFAGLSLPLVLPILLALAVVILLFWMMSKGWH